MTEKESFVFYKSFYESIRSLDNETKLEIFEAICNYSLYENEPEFKSEVSKAIFTLIRVNLDKAEARYRASIENGKKGGAPKGNQNAKKKQPKNNLEQPRNNLNYNLNDNLNDNYNISSIYEEIQNNYKNNLNQNDFELIDGVIENYPLEKWKEAIEISKQNGGRSIKYLLQVLYNPLKNTPTNRKQIKPKWLDMDLSNKEEEEIEDKFGLELDF